jgi:hypothetical protein
MTGDPATAAADLHAAGVALAGASLPPEVRARLQRQFIAVCDALKAPAADAATCERRVRGLRDVLARAIADNNS